MTTFTSRLPVFLRQLDADVPALRRELAKEAYESIVNGSSLTGAPGQPADLREGQWTIAETGPDTTTVGTSEKSARSVEDGISYKHGGRLLKKLKSPLGGFHSTKLTHQNAEPLVKKVVNSVRRGR